MQYFTLFNVIAFSIRVERITIQRYDLHKEVNHYFLGISKEQRKIRVKNDHKNN